MVEKEILLRVELDDVWPVEYFNTKHDIYGNGHSITIKEEDKEDFLDAMAKEFRNMIEQGLKPYKEE